MSSVIKVLIVDDHTLVRKGLRALLEARPETEVVVEAADGVEAVALAGSLRPDVILLDLMMPRKDGLEAIQEIKRENPDARILVLTSFAGDDKVFPAIKAGALGYLLKDSSPLELLQAIQAVHRGEASLHPSVALKVIHELNRPADLPASATPLTPREVEVLRLLAQGLSNAAIGAALSLSERTVGNHVGSILNKLQVANRTQAALYAQRKGLAGPGQEGED